MKTTLKIGPIPIGVLTISVICSAQSRGQSLPASPNTATEAPAGQGAAADFVALQKSFLDQIKAAGFSPRLRAPQIVEDNPLAFGNYELEKNVVHVAAWDHLSPQQKAFFSQLASASSFKMSAEEAFATSMRWIFLHELGHWWQACQEMEDESHYAKERGANRIAAAYWRMQDSKMLDWVAAAANARRGAFPDPVPDNQSVAAYFDANYESFNESAYLWFQNRMVLDVLDEEPPLSFRQALQQPTFPPPVSPQPSPEVLSLTKAIEGRWTTFYKFAPSDTMPNGGEGDGEEVWRAGPGGFTLMEEERIHVEDRDEFIFALHWWDKSTKSLRGMLCNNSGPAACNVDSYFNSSLKWDGKQLTIDMQFPQNGKKMLWHEVWSDITATSFTQTGDIGEVGGPLKRAVTIHGTKVTETGKDSGK
jgi:hypothetical protein